MGKTPERGTYRAMTATSTSDGNGHGGSSGLRYRRKVPASGKADAKAAVGEDNQRESAAATGGKRHEDGEDNQREHEQAAAVAPLAHGDVGAGNQACDAKKQKKKHKPRATSDDKAQSPDRDVSGKKDAQRKPKRGGQGDKNDRSVRSAQSKDINGRDAEAVESHRQPEVVAGVADAMIGSNSRHADRQTTHVDAPTTHDAAGLLPDAPTRAQHRRESGVEKHKRKHFARKEDKTTKRRPKQLQWKVKAQQPTAHVNEDADTSVRATASDSIDSTSRVEAVSESKKETDSVDEEVDFAVRERQLLKLRAKSLSYPLESSSQETQSGSDDDSATFIQFSRPLVPLPSISARIEDGSEQAVQEVTEALSSPEDLFFPAPFPLERVAALASARVHEILISDFAFHPPELQINAGDVVVWHVSEQTPGMVEHCLDVTLMRASDATAITTSTSTSSAGDKFAWRFEDAGAVTISCSVYNARGSVVVNGTQAPEPARTLSKRKRAKIKKQKKSKRLNEARAATNGSAMPQQATEASVELNGDVKGESEPVEIFHCPPELLNHGGVPNMDAGLCQAVLSQLDAVANSAIVGVNASSGGVLPVIVVGDVECPISEDAGQEADAGAAVIASDNAEDNNTDDEVADFQERVVAMLKRSEETQAEQRRSFVVDDSGFDALRAYDFFKRRFTDVQSSCERIVYL